MASHRSPAAHDYSIPALAGTGACWLTAGISVGLAATATLGPVVGALVAIGAGAAGLAIQFRHQSRGKRLAPESPAHRDETASAATALAQAMADLDHPDAALAEMLHLVGGAVGSRTVLLLGLVDGGTTLTVDHPAVVDGAVLPGSTSTSMRVADSGPLRMALAAGVPVAAPIGAGDPGPWERLAAAHGIECAVAVPLAAAGWQIGLLVVGTPGASVPRSEVARLHRLMPAAAASIGAMLRVRRLARTRAQSARSAQFRSDYASVVGHELRTPLTTILGVIKTLTRPELAPENPDARDLLDMAAAQGDRLKRLVEDMLAINQVDVDGITVHAELVSLPDIVNRAIDAVSGARGLATVHIQDLLPPVVLDPEHTKRILVNLLANAVKYGEDSPIEIGVKVDRTHLKLTVADHGPGLPPATAARAFDAFTQLKRTEVDAYGGVGLGLSISQGLVGAMGGTISHAPTAGGGATFVIRLPFKPHPAIRGAI